MKILLYVIPTTIVLTVLYGNFISWLYRTEYFVVHVFATLLLCGMVWSLIYTVQLTTHLLKPCKKC